ncbi:putative quinol monooxygenase [Microvirga roseola]|uniref:putative quinol monooxygenase n=1 Tax=Microvirga roseola TaxID=2883126 RepID=UPI001E34ECA4|nr:antibiotic biosynthesis monooxygenase [Microvirga roseola]
MLHVLAYITAKPGMRKTVLREFRANMPAVHAEEGCIEYVPVIDLPAFEPSQTELGPDTFAAVEKSASPEALKAHAAAPHMLVYAERAANMIETRMIHILSPL